MNTAIVIPARFGSTRFPGKPLAEIGGQSMLSRVVEAARDASEGMPGVDVMVTTEDERIAAHARDDLKVETILTPADCPTGSDRVLAALDRQDGIYDFALNLQGDAPFTPPAVIRRMIETLRATPSLSVVTPVVRLSWDELDALRESKQTTPFSGTTAIVDPQGRALWFSKNIIPAIRKEGTLRTESDTSPVFQHIGLYGYAVDVLRQFCALPPSRYEQLEGLEQLRLLEAGITIQTVEVTLPDGQMQSGIDTPEDLERANKRLAGAA